MNSLVNLLTFVILTSFRNTQSTSSSASSRFSVKRYDPIRAIYAIIHAKVRSMNLGLADEKAVDSLSTA